MQSVETKDLQKRYRYPLLLEVDGDQSHLASDAVEIVDVRVEHGLMFTILHVPSGTLPMATRRAMSIVYDDAEDESRAYQNDWPRCSRCGGNIADA